MKQKLKSSEIKVGMRVYIDDDGSEMLTPCWRKREGIVIGTYEQFNPHRWLVQLDNHGQEIEFHIDYFFSVAEKSMLDEIDASPLWEWLSSEM